MGSKPSKSSSKRQREGQQPADSPAMPLFRKQSSDAKKRLQHQLYLVRESPAPTFDISKCEISEVPSGVYSLCKVLQKEALLMHDNWLSSLKGGGNMRDLAAIKVLDVHDNEFTSLPDDIGNCLNCLEILNVENNRLKYLPESISQLYSLQTLNLRGNKLKQLPDSLATMANLRTLDISNNNLTMIPQQLCHIRTLETLVLDSEKMTYPPSEICTQGTEAIMMYLCQECGIEYIAPSNFTLTTGHVGRSANNRSSPSIDDKTDHIMQYENFKDKKRQELLRLEAQMEEEQHRQALLAAHAAANKEHLLMFVAQDQQRFDEGLNALQQQKEGERQRLINSLYEAEKNATELVEELLTMTEKARRMEELLERMERERIETEQWFIVRQEEIAILRKKEVLVNMEKILEEYHAFDHLIKNYMAGRDAHVRKVTETANDVDDRLDLVLTSKRDDQDELIKQLVREEALQKEAFEALQLQKDTKHQRLTNQIELIEQELAQLSLIEVEQRHLRSTTHADLLEDKRKTLTQLLVQLMGERSKRVEELKKRLAEMEAQRMTDQQDYWLIQYQRLMDRKPQSLIDQERQLEYAVIEILEAAGGFDYIASFARHRITIETLCQMTEDDLQQKMGIYEAGLRKTILSEVTKYKLRMEEERAALKLKALEEPKPDYMVRPPAAVDVPRPLEPTAPFAEAGVSPPLSPSITARGLNSECVVCMEQQSEILFLNCGHVCCCHKCAEPLHECPLCRSVILQRIKLAIQL